MQLKWEKQFAFTEGQYVSFLIDNHRRPLSIASQATEELLDFVIDVSPRGICSQFTLAVKIGDTVRYMAPYGRFVLNETDTRPRLFIATGTGIAPIRAHIKRAVAHHHAQPMTLLFGNSREQYILFHDEFTRLAATNKNFNYLPVLSEPLLAWPGQRGLVTQVIPTMPDITTYSAYICGHPDMVRDTKALLVEKLGMPKEFVHTEAYTPTTN